MTHSEARSSVAGPCHALLIVVRDAMSEALRANRS
jgi:hypothetical protein